jgi:alkyl hydroperoxide reductase subunit AhpC
MQLYERERERFRTHDAQVVGVSTDSRYANAAWAEQLGGIGYPLLSDFYPHGAVAQQYGVLRPEGMAERALFLIDREGVVRYIDVHTISEVPDEEALFEQLAALRSG